MSSEIRWGAQYVWVANRVLSRLLDFAEEVGRATARDAEEEALLGKLVIWRKEAEFPGINFDLNEVFPLNSEKKFWARVFHDVGRRVFLRQLGLHEATFWQTETIAVAHSIGAWLTRAVQSQEQWYPDTENSREAHAWHHRPGQ